MKQRAAEHGLHVAKMRMVRSAVGLMVFISEVSYPVVVKPVDGRGSNGVTIIKDDADLDAFLQSDSFTIYGDMLVESFVHGEMYQANGFYRNGQLICISVVKCINSCFEFLNGKSLGLQMVSESNPLHKKIVEYTDNLMSNVLPAPENTLFHLEIFVVDRDRITLCEVGSRLGGCVVNEEIHAAYGIDLRLELIKSMRDPAYQVVGDFRYYNRLIGQLNIPPEPGRLTHIAAVSPFDWTVLYRVNGKEGEVYQKMNFTNSEVANILVEGSSEQDIRDRFVSMERWFRGNTLYESAGS